MDTQESRLKRFLTLNSRRVASMTKSELWIVYVGFQSLHTAQNLLFVRIRKRMRNWGSTAFMALLKQFEKLLPPLVRSPEITILHHVRKIESQDPLIRYPVDWR